ncbi:MAG: ABC transporter permease [Bacteroidales bacterium]|nr:ABC transporter permease [Bacteroidales bacterium]
MSIIDYDKWQEIVTVLKKNKLRTFFTAFGVFWGIFLLVIMMGSGNGLRNSALEGFGNMATNSFFMWTQRTTMPHKGFQRGRFFNFRNADTEAIKQNIPEVDKIAPRLQARGFRGGGNNVIRGERTGAFDIYGDTPLFFEIMPMIITNGRFINKTDVDERRKVIVIGNRVFQEMFKAEEDPIGEYLQIQGVYFKVVGVVKSKQRGHNAERDEGSIYMPFTTLQQTYNYGDIVGWYSITAKKGIPASEVEAKTKEFMKIRHHIHPDDNRAIGSWNMENEFNKFNNLFNGITILVWIVGMGTLFAGVVGVSNIMLIVVKERTKEIGIQRAIGAPPAAIISQIIIESVFLTTLAGYVGLVIGVGLLELVNYLLVTSGVESDMFSNPEINFNMAMSALGILVISGILAGLIPAKRAVSIKPIDALRDE